MLTRDSWVWVLGLLAAIIGYLVTAQKPPTAWTYMEWLQAASFVVAYLVGRFASSPLAASTTSPKDYREALGGLLRLTDKP